MPVPSRGPRSSVKLKGAESELHTSFWGAKSAHHFKHVIIFLSSTAKRDTSLKTNGYRSMNARAQASHPKLQRGCQDSEQFANQQTKKRSIQGKPESKPGTIHISFQIMVTNSQLSSQSVIHEMNVNPFREFEMDTEKATVSWVEACCVTGAVSITSSFLTATDAMRTQYIGLGEWLQTANILLSSEYVWD